MMEETNLKSKLPAELYDLLQKVEIDDPQDLILKSNAELQCLAPFSSKDIKLLKKVAAEIVLCKKRFLTGLEMHMNTSYHIRRLKIGCPLMDNILNGGLICKGVSEISGESGSGKTQICLQLSIIVQYPEEQGGLNAGAIYICTEDVFPSKRLQQLFTTFPPAFQYRYRFKSNFTTNFSDNIYIEHASDAETLVQIICKDVPLLMANRKIGLVVIDSIAAVFRIEAVSPKRSNMMRAIGSTLHKLANDYGAVVICINQVSSNINTGMMMPCLGLSWANLTTTKIQLLHNWDNPSISHNEKSSLRTFSILSAPHLPPNSVTYKVDEAGISSAM